MVNFFTFKWGNKYDSIYVNRLYRSIQKHYNGPFNFHCITDNSIDINPDIQIIDFNTFDPFDYPKDRVWTREKLVLFKKFKTGINVWIDLDILIHNDITDAVHNVQKSPTFIWNHWRWDPEDNRKSYGRGYTCYVNSSFVRWEGNQGEHIFDALWKDRKYAFYTYNSFDKYLFYHHWRKNHLTFWDKSLWYNYNFSTPKQKYNPNALGCLFNTSHITDIYEPDALELHETKDWAYELWTS